MTINGKAVAIRSFVRLEVEQQLGRKDREECSQDGSWKEFNCCFNSIYSGLLAVNNLCKSGAERINRLVKKHFVMVHSHLANNECLWIYRSADDAVNLGLDFILHHLNHPGMTPGPCWRTLPWPSFSSTQTSSTRSSPSSQCRPPPVSRSLGS
ncbi:hypothetical protein ATANTOWER_026117 [Ataeniobius toweri]|uniref:Transposase n=1 Tax=Ataeniobius toweri TaxID=208326 RepID=A0ABU7C132_9TELE|nr:hypothetical protein [Ataeniobius toweri]